MISPVSGVNRSRFDAASCRVWKEDSHDAIEPALGRGFHLCAHPCWLRGRIQLVVATPRSWRCRWDVQGSRYLKCLRVSGGSGRRIVLCGRRCVLRAGRSRLVRCSGTSGGGSLRESRRSRPRRPSVCHGRSGRGGSSRLTSQRPHRRCWHPHRSGKKP